MGIVLSEIPIEHILKIYSKRFPVLVRIEKIFRGCICVVRVFWLRQTMASARVLGELDADGIITGKRDGN